MSSGRCAWCGRSFAGDGQAPPLLRVCPECANNGRLRLEPEPPERPHPLEVDPDSIPRTPGWIRATASGLLMWTAVGLVAALALAWSLRRFL